MCRVYGNMYSDDGEREYIYPPSVASVEKWLEENGFEEVSVYVTDTEIEISHVVNEKLNTVYLTLEEWEEVTPEQLKQ